MTKHTRAATLSAPSCTFFPGDPVLIRRHPGAHEEHARVLGRTYEARPRYDVETADGDRLTEVTIIRLDEEAARLQRIAEGVA